MSAALEVAREVLARLASGSLGAALFAAGVWLLLRRARRLAPAWRAALWWLVGAKALLALAGSLPLAWLPAPRSTPVAATPAIEVRVLDLEPASVPVAAAATVSRPTPGASPRPPGFAAALRALPIALLALWAAIVAGLAARAALARHRLARALALARPVESALAARVGELARRVGLARSPRIAWSEAVETPAIVGLAWPTILLPTAERLRLGSGDLDLAIAHELAHVARRDLVWGLVPALAERLFFFHPLVRLAAREYALEREAACDRWVVERLEAPAERYGRLLVALGVVPRRAPIDSVAIAVSAPSTAALRRRLEMLARTIDRSRSARWRWAAVFALALGAALPVRLVAGAPRPEPTPAPEVTAGTPAAPIAEATPAPEAEVATAGEPAAAVETPPPPRPAPVPALARPGRAAMPAPAIAPAARLESLPTPAPTALAPAARLESLPTPAPTPLAPAAPIGWRASAGRATSRRWAPAPPVTPAPPSPPAEPAASTPAAPPVPPSPPSPGGSALAARPPLPPTPVTPPAPPAPPRSPWRYLDDDDDLDGFVLLYDDHRSINNASRADLRRAERLRDGNRPIFLFYYRGDRYVVRDPARVKQIEDLFQAQVDAGERQAELGAQQAGLGARQAELGSRQAALGAEQAGLAAEQAALGWSRDAEAETRLREIDGKMDELGRKQGELGRQMDELGGQMDQLGRQMDAVGRTMDEAARRASVEIKKILDQWVAAGVAEKVD